MRRWTTPVSVLTAAVLGASLFLAACDETSTDVPVPSGIELTGGDAQVGVVGQSLAQLLSVRVVDGQGNAFAGVPVEWEVVSGDGALSASSATNADGVAEATWTLGTTAGEQTARASVPSVGSVPFTATAEAGEATVLTVSEDSLSFHALGSTAALSVQAEDEFGNAVDVSGAQWSSAEASVASVDGSGTVTAVAKGQTEIAVTVGDLTEAVVVRVQQVAAAVIVSGPTEPMQSLGDTLQMTAVAEDANGHAIADAVATWSSADTAVATVDSDGVVTSRGAGRTEIVAGVDEVTSAAAVVVEPTAAALALQPDTLLFDALEDTASLSAEAFDANGNPITAELAWTISSTAVADLSDDGTVTARGPGATQVIVTSGSVADTAHVIVDPVVAAVEIAALSQDTLRAIGDTLALAATATDANGFEVDGATIGWMSDDTAVVTVDASGDVVARGAGSTHILATAGEHTDTVSIHVRQVVTSVVVTPAADTVAVGETTTLSAAAMDGNGHVAPDAEFAWTSSDAAAATVDSSGMVTAESIGSAVVQASSGGASGSAAITVIAAAVDHVVVTPDTTLFTATGETASLVATAFDGNGNAIVDAIFDWSSSDDAVVAVNSSGVVTAVAEGSVWVRATSDGSTDSAVVVVDLPAVPTGIAIAPAEATVVVDGSVSFAAEVTDSDGGVIAEAEIGWSSLDPTSATVDSTGVATGLAEGIARIIATFEALADTATLEVQAVPVDSVELTPDSIRLTALGDTTRLSAAAFDASGGSLPGRTFEWSSADTTVASVADGLVTAVAPGSTWVRVSSGGAADSAEVVVRQEPASLEIVAGDGQSGPGGEALPDSLLVRLLDTGQSPIAGRSVVWTAGAGSIDPDTVNTDVEGRAAAVWVLPNALGTFAATAALLDDTLTAAFSATVTAAVGNTACTTGTPVEHATNITAAETWAAGDPHWVTASIVVSNGSLLTIDPGAVVCVGAGLALVFDGGALNARGTVSDSIRFYPLEGGSDWGGLHFRGADSFQSYLGHLTLEHAAVAVANQGGHQVSLADARIRQTGGIRLSASVDGFKSEIRRVVVDTTHDARDGIAVNGLDHILEDVAVRSAGRHGISMPDLRVTLRRVTVENSAGTGISLSTGHGYGGITLDGVRISGSGGMGLRAPTGSVASASGVRVTASDSFGVAAGLDVLGMLAPTRSSQDSLMGNAMDTLVVLGGRTAASLVVRGDLPWRVHGGIGFDSASTLTIEPAASLHFGPAAGADFWDARLDARGTAENPILMTAIDPDAGHWGGLSFYSPSLADTSWIHHARIEYPAGGVSASAHVLSMKAVHARHSGRIQASSAANLRNVTLDTSSAGAYHADGFVLNGEGIVADSLTVRGVRSVGILVNGADLGVELSFARITGAGGTGLEIRGSRAVSILRDVRVTDAGGTGMIASPGSVESAADVRVVGSGSYGAQLGLDILGKITRTPADQDSLMGNAQDTIVILGGHLVRDTVTIRATFPWRVDSATVVDTLSLLVAEPGTSLHFSGGGQSPGGLQFHNGGHFNALGTVTDPVWLGSTATGAAWGGLHFASPDTLPTASSLSNVEITDAHGVIGYHGGVHARGSHRVLIDGAKISRSTELALNSDSSALLNASLDTMRWGGLNVGGSHVALRNLTVANTSGTGHGIQVRVGAVGIQLTDIHVRQVAGIGILLEGRDAVARNVRTDTTGAEAMVVDTMALADGGGVVLGMAGALPRLALDAIEAIAPTPIRQDSLFAAADTVLVAGGLLRGDSIRMGPGVRWKITEQVLVLDTSAVVVAPGTRIDMGYSFTVDGGGSFTAEGTADSMVQLVGTDPDVLTGILTSSNGAGGGTLRLRNTVIRDTRGFSLWDGSLALDSTRVVNSRGIRLVSGTVDVRRSAFDSLTSPALTGGTGDYPMGGMAPFHLEDVIIRDAQGNGLQLSSPGTDMTSRLERVEVTGASGEGIWVHTGDRVEIHNSNIYRNAGHELYMWNYGSVPVTLNATNNWWGQATAPDTSQVTVRVSFGAEIYVDPWLTEPANLSANPWWTMPDTTLPTVVDVEVTAGLDTLLVGDTATFSASALDSVGGSITGASFTWESSHPAVATVDSTGFVTAVGTGAAWISATTSGGVRDSAQIEAVEVLWSQANDELGGGGDIWGSSSMNIYTGTRGSDGRLLYYDGSSWSPIILPDSTFGTQAIWGTSASDMWVLGQSTGTTLHYDGSSWTTTSPGFAGIWGFSSTDVYAVSGSGYMYQYDGTSWSLIGKAINQAHHDLWGSSSTNVFAVGANGTIVHYDGSTMSTMSSGTTADLYGSGARQRPTSSPRALRRNPPLRRQFMDRITRG